MHRPTIREVAERARVSTQTVSRVINKSPRVAPETRERVQAVVQELGYEPSSLARGLVTHRTRSIGVIVYDIANPFFAQLVRGVEDAAYALGYDVIIGNSDADAAKEASYISLFSRRRVDAILAAVTLLDWEYWRRVPCPIVFLDNLFDTNECSYVTTNNREASYQAVKHLLDLGHRRVAMVTAPLSDVGAVHARYLGYREALLDHGVSEDEGLLYECRQHTEAEGYRAGQRLLGGRERPTAVFCQNDIAAIGVIRAILETGLRIPRDISVLGFDDIPVASVLCVPLTTVAQPIHAMGAAAVGLMMERLKGGPATPPRQIVLETHLVIRQSTAAPATVLAGR